jgi:hypothetical protein
MVSNGFLCSWEDLGGHTRFYFGGTYANIDTLSRNLLYIFEEEKYFKVEVQNI